MGLQGWPHATEGLIALDIYTAATASGLSIAGSVFPEAHCLFLQSRSHFKPSTENRAP